MSKSIIKKELTNYLNNNVFIEFLNIPVYENSQNEHSDNYSNLKLISEKLDLLLKLPHQEFWCHILFDTSILRSLQSYFNHATRPHEIILNGNTWHELEKKLHKKYYLLILRLISNKEVNIPEFNNINYGTLIYDNFIIDIPFLFDLCSLYGECNSEVINKMIMLVFSCQPLYMNDFGQYGSLTMKFLEEKVNDFISSDSKISKERNILQLNKVVQSTEEKSHELLHYIIDVCYSWNMMLNVVKSKMELFQILFDISFHKTIEKLFQKFVPIVHSQVDKFAISDPEKLKQLLSVCCFFMISVWRQIFNRKFIEKFDEIPSSEENFQSINECLSVISSCQEFPIFADAMYVMFPIQHDFDRILQTVQSDKDQFYSAFVIDSIKEITREINTRQTIFSSQTLIENHLATLSLDRDSEPERSNCTDSNILQIRDIYPVLTEAEIKAYMNCNGYNPTNLLDSLLNEVITVDLIKETTMNNRKELENITTLDYRSVLSNHRNIYDGDQLETGQVKPSQLHIGKRQTKLSDTVDPNLRNMILNIVQNQDEDEFLDIPFNGNLTYNDEFDDVYGISHDGIVDKKIEEEEQVNFESDKVASIYKLPNNKGNEMNYNKTKTVSSVSSKDSVSDKQIEENKTIMEPSKVKYSAYDKRQYKKKRYQDGPNKVSNGVNNGPTNHRLGSHGPQENHVKKDHRSKPHKNKFCDS